MSSLASLAGPSANDWAARTNTEDYVVPRWYAAYTSARHEKSVANQFRCRGVRYFLPLLESLQRWSDRRIRVQLPYFPGYVFVHIAHRDRLLVLQTPGVVRIVGTRTSPTVVPDVQIETLQTALHLGLRVGPHPAAEIGRRVYIRSGPLLGTEGILLRRKGRCRVVVSIQAIMRAFAVEVNEQDIQPAPG